MSPEYLYEDPDTGEVKSVFQNANDEHKYEEKAKVKHPNSRKMRTPEFKKESLINKDALQNQIQQLIFKQLKFKKSRFKNSRIISRRQELRCCPASRYSKL